MKTGRDTTLMAALIAITILTFVALILSISSIALQRWMSYDVKNESEIKPDTNLIYFDRWRGMFMECIKNTDKAEFVKTPDAKRTSTCYALDMGGQHWDTDDRNYWFIMRLRRAHVAMGILSIIFIFLTVLLAGAALVMLFLHDSYETPLHSRVIRGTGVACLLALLCYLSTLFIFHVMMDEEKIASTNLLPGIYRSWPETLMRGTYIRYASAYFLLWASFFCALLAALILLSMFCWGLDRLKQTRTVHTVEEKTVLMGGHYGQPMMKQDTVQTVSVTPVHTAPSM